MCPAGRCSFTPACGFSRSCSSAARVTPFTRGASRARTICKAPAPGGESMKGFATTFAALGLAISALVFAHAQQIGATDVRRGLADPSRWLTYSGDYASTRHSPLTQITPENVARLTPVWTFDSGL